MVSCLLWTAYLRLNTPNQINHWNIKSKSTVDIFYLQFMNEINTLTSNSTVNKKEIGAYPKLSTKFYLNYHYFSYLNNQRVELNSWFHSYLIENQSAISLKSLTTRITTTEMTA